MSRSYKVFLGVNLIAITVALYVIFNAFSFNAARTQPEKTDLQECELTENKTLQVNYAHDENSLFMADSAFSDDEDETAVAEEMSDTEVVTEPVVVVVPESVNLTETEKRVYDYYMCIPAQIRAQFEASDWTYYVYEDDALRNLCGYEYEIMGITAWSNQVIVIDRRESSASAIVHEVGHWMSRYYNGGVDGELLLSVYESDWQNLYARFGGSSKNYDSPDEFVAEAFSHYVLYPAELMDAAPSTYAFIDGFVNGI